MAFHASIEEVERFFVTEFKKAQSETKLLASTLVQFLQRSEELPGRSKAQTQLMVIFVVIPNDGVRLAAAGVAIREEAAVAADEDVGDGRLDDAGVGDGVVVLGEQDVFEGWGALPGFVGWQREGDGVAVVGRGGGVGDEVGGGEGAPASEDVHDVDLT